MSTLFLRNRYLLVLSILVLLVAGGSALVNMPRLEDPRIVHRNPLLITPFPGASAERVDALVTEPLEQQLQEVSEIKDLESTSRAGVSIIAIELDAGVNAETNQEVFSKLRDKIADAAPLLPPGVRTPIFDDKRDPSAFTLMTGKDHRYPLLRARAIETQSFVLAAAQWGKHDDRGLRQSYGHSIVVDPWGQVMGAAPDGPGLALAEIDLDRVASTRRSMPVESHRRL